MSQLSSTAVARMGIDIGKSVFHVVGLDAKGKPVFKGRFNRERLLEFLARASPTIVGMEACPGSNWLARKAAAYGHQIRGHSRSDFSSYHALHPAQDRSSARFAGSPSSQATPSVLQDRYRQSGPRFLAGIWHYYRHRSRLLCSRYAAHYLRREQWADGIDATSFAGAMARISLRRSSAIAIASSDRSNRWRRRRRNATYLGSGYCTPHRDSHYSFLGHRNTV